ncbi:MAG: hypothetical protein AB8F34_06725 [Akkermansiaceae bacterium]
MTIKSLSILLLITASPFSQADEMIRQSQLSSGLTWDYHATNSQGSAWAPIAVGQGGSLFTLYSAGKTAHDRVFKLDESTMGTAFPTVELTVVSQDPHVPARTRADQPFSLKLKRHGASNKVISLKHTLEKYNPATRSNDPRMARKHSWWQLPTNPSQAGIFHPSVPAAVNTQAEGEETFAAYATGKNGKELHPLKSASIQIWPVATARIDQLNSNATIQSTQNLKNVTVNCKNLYPDSVTYVQIYKGKQQLGTLGRILPQTIIRFDTEVPQDQKIPLGEWADSIQDGQYTIELLHITPFNEGKPERLAYKTFVIDRGMHSPSLVNN